MEFNKHHDSENILSTSEPHLGSFVPANILEPSPESVTPEFTALGTHEEFEDETTSEEKADRSLSIVFMLIGALTVIAGLAYYVNNVMSPKEVMDDESTMMVGDQYGNTEDRNLFDTNSNQLAQDPNGNQNFSFYDNTRPVFDPNYIAGGNQGTVEPTEDTFAKPNSQTQNGSIDSGDIVGRQPFEIVTTEVVTGMDPNPSYSSSTSTVRTQSLSQRTISNELGISFLKDPFWSQSVSASGNSMTIRKVGPTGRDIIFMTRFKGKNVITTDSKYGNRVYFFDPVEKVWMRQDYVGGAPTEQDVASFFVPMKLTRYGKAILEGTTSYKTLIIAFGVEDFLIVNINGTGHTSILNSFVYEIKNIN